MRSLCIEIFFSKGGGSTFGRMREAFSLFSMSLELHLTLEKEWVWSPKECAFNSEK